MSHRFVIGIGSQRAASTLLHRLIGESTDVFMHPVKELHYFDTLFGVRSQEALTDFSLRQLGREVDRVVAATDYKFIGRRYKCFLRTTKILATTPVEKIDYLDLYRPFLQERSILGEVTPEYMLFDEVQVERMQSVVGEDASIILMCRNPVDRLLSAAKLFNTYNNLRMDETQLGTWLKRMIDENSPWIQAQDRYNDYECAIRVYSAAFPRFLALSYEQLIDAPAAAAERIESTCDIAIDQRKFCDGLSTVSNSLGEQAPADRALAGGLAARYRRQAEFLQSHFGAAMAR
jgi:hypothetical protein